MVLGVELGLRATCMKRQPSYYSDTNLRTGTIAQTYTLKEIIKA